MPEQTTPEVLVHSVSVPVRQEGDKLRVQRKNRHGYYQQRETSLRHKCWQNGEERVKTVFKYL